MRAFRTTRLAGSSARSAGTSPATGIDVQACVADMLRVLSWSQRGEPPGTGWPSSSSGSTSCRSGRRAGCQAAVRRTPDGNDRRRDDESHSPGGSGAGDSVPVIREVRPVGHVGGVRAAEPSAASPMSARRGVAADQRHRLSFRGPRNVCGALLGDRDERHVWSFRLCSPCRAKRQACLHRTGRMPGGGEEQHHHDAAALPAVPDVWNRGG